MRDKLLFEQGELSNKHGPSSHSLGPASVDIAGRENSRGGATRSESVSSVESVSTGQDDPG